MGELLVSSWWDGFGYQRSQEVSGQCQYDPPLMADKPRCLSQVQYIQRVQKTPMRKKLLD